MQLINYPDAIYPAGNSLGWTFPIKIRGVETSHGYDSGCPQPATNAAKANGTVTIYVREASSETPPTWAVGDIAEADGDPIDEIPVTALEDDGTSLEFTLYAPLDAALKYQMQATILVPDPDNAGEFLEFKVLENFQISDKAI